MCKIISTSPRIYPSIVDDVIIMYLMVPLSFVTSNKSINLRWPQFTHKMRELDYSLYGSC